MQGFSNQPRIEIGVVEKNRLHFIAFQHIIV
jgi:hypothetical protein